MPNAKQMKKIRKKLDALMLKRMGIKTDVNLKGLRKNPSAEAVRIYKEKF